MRGYLALACVLALVAACAGVQPTGDPSPSPDLPPVTPDNPTPPPSPGAPTASPGETPAAGVEMVLLNGQVITVDLDFSMAEAVAVEGGRIIAVGSSADVGRLAGPGTRVVDLEGRTLMPGLVDTHTHLLQHVAESGTDALTAAEDEFIRNGRTTIGNPGIQPHILERLDEFAATGQSRLRVHLYLAYNDFCDTEFGNWYGEQQFSRDATVRMAVAGIKLFLDGGACDAPAVSFEWDTPRWSGPGDLFVTPDEVAGLIDVADGLGAQVVMHSAGDRALDAGLEGLAMALADRSNVNGHRIDHWMFARPDQLARPGELGVMPVLFGTHQSCLDTEDSSVVRHLDGEQLAWLEPRRQLIDANPGLPVGWHSDAPLLAMSPFDHLAGLTGLGERLGGGPAGCESEILRGHAVTTREALTMMTIGSAHAMQLEDDIGSIEQGKAADLVVLARDPLPLHGAEHLDNAIVATIVDGRLEWCDAEQAAFCSDSAEPPPPAAGPVTASAHLPGGEPERAIDGNRQTAWMAGGEPPQWIEIDLGTERHVERVVLVVDQDPAGFTRHVVYGGSIPAPTHQLAVLEGHTEINQVIQVDINATVRFVRIETVESPSWVGWLEIELP